MQMRIVEGMAGVNSHEALYAALQQFHKVLRLLDKGQQDLVCHGGPCTDLTNIAGVAQQVPCSHEP